MVKIQGLFKAFECFSSTFQSKFNFQELFKTVPVYSSTFQACANPVEFQSLKSVFILVNGAELHEMLNSATSILAFTVC